MRTAETACDVTRGTLPGEKTAAQSRHQQGIAQVLFTLDRLGRVIHSRIVRSSGASMLDEEALALLARAQPFPPPPHEVPGERVDLSVPIRFNLR